MRNMGEKAATTGESGKKSYFLMRESVFIYSKKIKKTFREEI